MRKTRLRPLRVLVLLAVVASLAGGAGWLLLRAGAGRAAVPASPLLPAAYGVPSPYAVRRDTFPEERQLFLEAARTAWAYVDREYQPATGMVNSVTGYPYATLWDVASGLAALYCAERLGFLPREEYDRRMRRALETLRKMRLYDGAAFNKNYSTRSGAIAGRSDRDTQGAAGGYGWSSTDLGRLLVWLHVIRSTQPEHAEAAEAVVRRLDLSRIVADGYLWGEDVGRSGRKRRYTEGRIPYEQYAAAGFAAWGHRAEKALDLNANAFPITVMDVPLVSDRRGDEHLTSEPIVLMGLELGWTPEMRELALRMLAAQRERHERTGVVTVVSEDAIPRAPHYFYYYNVNLKGRWFAVAVQSSRKPLEGPRWVSAKAAFGWHALLPSEYTKLAVRTVAPARHPGRGWSSGVYEQSLRPTGGENVNTAAVIMEAALYHVQGGPLARPAGR